jgi:transposase
VEGVDEARAVIRRLDRIEALEREGAHARTLLAELRELVREAEAWARLEGDERAQRAVERVEEAMAIDIVRV